MNTTSEFDQPKLTKWKNEPTVNDLKYDYQQATSPHSAQVGKIESWLDLLNIEGSAKMNKVAGKSSVQPQLIRKQAEWRYAALSEPFLNNEDVFAVSPKTWQDREAAKQNELILNYQFNNQLNKTYLIDNYVRAAVNEGTVIARVSWDYEEATVTETIYDYTYEDATEPRIINKIAECQKMYMQGSAKFKTLPQALQESVLASIENDRPIYAKPVKSEESEVVKVIKNQPRVDICDPRNIIIDPTCNGVFDNANFIIYSFEASLSELNKLGFYENLDDIQIPDAGTSDSAHYNLNPESGFHFADDSRKKFVVFEYWGYWDIDNSGETTPIVATWVGDQMIRMEKNPYPDGKLPFVVVPYLPVKNSVYGEPDASLLEDNQKLIGALTRGMIDSMARSANAQIGMRKDALDSINERKYKSGQDYKFNPNVDPRLAVIEHSYPELPASTFNMLQLFNMEAESLTGVKSFSGGLSGDALGNTATGVKGLLDASGKRELAILRRLAKGIEDIGKKILAMNSKWLSDTEVIRITDEEFVGINRDNLAGAYDIKLSISTAESDNIKAQELSFMLQTMGQSLPFEMTQIILSEIARLRNMPDLSKLIGDFIPQPNPMQEIEQQKAQLEMQLVQAQVQDTLAAVQLKQAQIQQALANTRKIGTEANLNDLEFVETESGVKQERELELQQAQAQGNLKRDITKSILDTQLKQPKETK